MSFTRFSFKWEPFWILVFSFAPAGLGLFVFLLVLLLRWLHRLT